MIKVIDIDRLHNNINNRENNWLLYSERRSGKTFSRVIDLLHAVERGETTIICLLTYNRDFNYIFRIIEEVLSHCGFKDFKLYSNPRRITISDSEILFMVDDKHTEHKLRGRDGYFLIPMRHYD